ncbi:MAG: hypothetical protein KGI41_04145 [Patescibacteria group bacterium]|nr:hypothetical protein [Patescibacteria group bacterium]
MTGYNAVSWQTDADPSVTASGAFSNPEVVAARSHDLAKELPFGTVIAVTGPADKQNSCGFGAVSGLIGYRVIADTMNESMHQHVDILFANDASIPLGGGKSLNASNVLGVCDGVTITVVGRIRMKDIPKTQAELAALVEGTRAPLAVADK